MHPQNQFWGARACSRALACARAGARARAHARAMPVHMPVLCLGKIRFEDFRFFRFEP